MSTGVDPPKRRRRVHRSMMRKLAADCCGSTDVTVIDSPIDRNGPSDTTARKTTAHEAPERYLRLRESFKPSIRSIRCRRRPLVAPADERDNGERRRKHAAHAAQRTRRTGHRRAYCRRSSVRTPIRRTAHSRRELARRTAGRQPARRPAACHRTSGSAVPAAAAGTRRKPPSQRPIRCESRAFQE